MIRQVYNIPKNMRIVIENAISLLTIKGMEYLLAFITFPYLVRVLHVSNFGLLAFVTSIIQYFILITDYGFNLSGPRDIAQHNQLEKRAEVFSGIIGAKIVLLLICTVIFFIGIFVISKFVLINIGLYLATYLLVIGNALFPIWFFQGIQKMRYITIVNIIARLISVTGIFIFVRSEDDIVIAALFQAMVPMVAAIASWFIIIKSYREMCVCPNICNIRTSIKNGWTFFTSMIAINVYTASIVVILGIMTNTTIVGYYSAANRIIDSIKGLLNPIVQAIYPFISKMATESKRDTINILKKIFWGMTGSNLLVGILIILTAPLIIRILLGDGYDESINILRIMSLLPAVIIMSNVLGIFTMLTFGMEKEFSRILIKSAVFDLIIVWPLIYFYDAIGAALTMLLAEIFVTVGTWKAVKGSEYNFLD